MFVNLNFYIIYIVKIYICEKLQFISSYSTEGGTGRTFRRLKVLKNKFSLVKLKTLDARITATEPLKFLAYPLDTVSSTGHPFMAAIL